MIEQSELILNRDGSIFHLHLHPEDLAHQVILVGDQNRVDLIAQFFDKIELKRQNREFRTITGWYKSNRITVLSTGIGTDNIDIVLNELDALVNIDLNSRLPKEKKTRLQIIRIGTSGSIQAHIPVNSYVVSEKAIGFDGLLNFYQNRDNFCDLEFEQAFKLFTKWSEMLPSPYVIKASDNLLNAFNQQEFIKGITISAPGFYGPQGRVLRLPLARPDLNKRIENFVFNSQVITNFEMECSAIYGLSSLLGHDALTVCLIIANRVLGKANENYSEKMKILIPKVLDRLIK